MKSLPIANLKPNTLLTAPAFLDESFILFSPETPVTQETVNLLLAWGYREIQGDDALTAKTVLETEAIEPPQGSFQDDAADALGRAEAQKIYSGLLEYTHKLFEVFLSRQTIAVDPLTEQVKALIEAQRRFRKYLLRLPELDRSGFSYTVGHCVNVAILAVAIGDALKQPSFRLVELGIAGLLHEIGMFRLPNTFQNANRALTEAEKRAVKAHPILGYRALKELNFSPNVTMAILEHHEKEDGSGYPQGLKGDRITVSAKILAVAAAYDAQITSRPFQAARSGYSSLLELMRESRRSYDENVLRKLVYLLSLYPLGSVVELANGSLAQVYDSNPEDAKHPEVRILTDEKRSLLTEWPLVKLAERPDLAIRRVLNSDEIARLRADNLLPA